MLERTFGIGGPKVSVITFGSMRFPTNAGLDAAARLLGEIWDAGVTSFHSSAEYDTHEAFCAALRRLREGRPEIRPTHISKIAVPHFEDPPRFDPALLRSRVERQLLDLGTERLDIVQWLLRSKPLSDDARLRTLEDDQEVIRDAWDRLRAEGKVDALASFPYSTPFAERVVRFDPCKGLITYLNLAELDSVPLLTSLHERGAGFIAIRPLAAGRLTERLWTTPTSAAEENLRLTLERLGVRPETAASFAMRFPLLHPAVSSAMVSISSGDHLRSVVRAVESVTPNEAEFRELARCVATAA